MALGYLLSPALQVEDTSGKPLVGGHITVYKHGTTIPYITHKNFDGDVNPAEVILDAKGMCVLLADDTYTYDVYCTDRNRVEQWSRKNVIVCGVSLEVSGLDKVYHDQTMTGDGTSENPLSVESTITQLQYQIDQKLDSSDYTAPVQSSWSEADTTSLAYIQDKPNLALKEDVANKTTIVRQNGEADNTKYPTEAAVRTAIDSAVSSAYHAAGSKTVAQLTSSLLVFANEGDVYNITDSGTTTADFIEGAGYPISVGDNVVVCDVGAGVYKFDLLSGFVDLSNYLTKTGDGSEVTASFTTASTRTNISTGEKLSVLFGKIAKWFSDLKALAFKDKVADSDISGTLSDAHIASASTWNAKQDAISTDTDSSTISDSTTIATGYSSDKVHLNTAARLWDYIQNKISTVLGLTASKYNGIADTAVKLPLAWGGFDVQEGYRLLANITAPGAWNDRICTFNVFEKQAGQSDPVGQCGILTVQIRNSNNTISYGVTYNRSANNRLDIVARSNTDKSVSLYVYSSGDIYGGLQLELVSSSYYTGNPTGREGITLYNNNSLQSTVTGDTVTINYPITYLENDSVTADKVKDNETLPVNITGYASHLRQARCRFSNDETGYRLMAYLPPESGYSDAVYVFNIYEARDAAILDKGVLKGTLSICIRNNNGSYQYSSSYTGYSLSDIGLELRVDESLHGVRLYAANSNQYYCTAIYELLNAYQLNGPEMNPLLYNNNHLSSYIGGTVITPTYTLLKQSGGTIPLANDSGVGSTTTPVYVNSSGTVQACDGVIAKNLESSLCNYGTSGSKFRLVMKSAPLGNTVNVHFECRISASNYSLFQSATLLFNAVYSQSENSITFSKVEVINDYGSSNLWRFYLVPNVVEHKVEIYAESIGSNYNSLNLIALFANGEGQNYINGTTYLHTVVNSIPTPNVEVPVRKDVTTDTSVGSNTTPVYIDSNGVPQACDNRIHDLTLQRKYIRTYGEINGRNILCDRQSWTGTAEQPEFTPISPNDLCTWLNRGDVINIDLTLYDWWGDKYPAWIVEAQCDVSAGETTGTCTNLMVLRKKQVNGVATVDFQWSDLITDEDTNIRYMEFQSI